MRISPNVSMQSMDLLLFSFPSSLYLSRRLMFHAFYRFFSRFSYSPVIFLLPLPSPRLFGALFCPPYSQDMVNALAGNILSCSHASTLTTRPSTIRVDYGALETMYSARRASPQSSQLQVHQGHIQLHFSSPLFPPLYGSRFPLLESSGLARECPTARSFRLVPLLSDVYQPIQDVDGTRSRSILSDLVDCWRQSCGRRVRICVDRNAGLVAQVSSLLVVRISL